MCSLLKFILFYRSVLDFSNFSCLIYFYLWFNVVFLGLPFGVLKSRSKLLGRGLKSTVGYIKLLFFS